MVCLDTTFLIDVLRGREPAARRFPELQQSSESLTIAAPTLFELVEGAALARSDKEKKDIKEFLSSLTLLPLDEDSAWKAGELSAHLIMAGNQIGQMDLLIGAIGALHRETLLTANVSHFSRIPGLSIEGYTQ